MSVCGSGDEGCAIRSDTMTKPRPSTRITTTASAVHFTMRIVAPPKAAATLKACGGPYNCQNGAMTEARNMLAETAEKALSGDSWSRVVDSGLVNVMVPEDKGGFGGG